MTIHVEKMVAVSVVAIDLTAGAYASAVDYVDPFIGSGGEGHTTPSATSPFGMMQAGRPEKAAERLRDVLGKFFAPRVDGLCGNDDCGRMSAWYLFAVMGFYPVDPCGGELVFTMAPVAPGIPTSSCRSAS